MMAILGVLFAVVYMAVFYGGTAISVALTPLGLSAFGFELIYGVWFMAATIAAYIIRKPGAALITEVLASAIELLMGNSGGATVVLTGLIQGVGCELGFAVFRYRKYNLLSMALSGVFAAVCIFCYELYYLSYYLLAPAVAATHQVLRDRPAEVRAFLAALDRGYQEAARDPEGAVLAVKDGLPAVSEAMLVRSQRHLAPLLLDQRGHWGAIRPERWERMADWLVANGYYDRRRPTEYTNDFLPV